MKNQHTPGPWLARCQGVDSHHANCRIVAIWNGDGLPLGDAVADAKLIKSAPKLLKALSDLVADFDKSVLTTDPMLIEARAVIAAATGQDR